MVYAQLAPSFLPIRAAVLAASAVHLHRMGQLPQLVVSIYRDSLHQSLNMAETATKEGSALAASLLLSITTEVSVPHSPLGKRSLRLTPFLFNSLFERVRIAGRPNYGKFGLYCWPEMARPMEPRIPPCVRIYVYSLTG